MHTIRTTHSNIIPVCMIHRIENTPTQCFLVCVSVSSPAFRSPAHCAPLHPSDQPASGLWKESCLCP